jgi:hypothetical protein
VLSGLRSVRSAQNPLKGHLRGTWDCGRSSGSAGGAVKSHPSGGWNSLTLGLDRGGAPLCPYGRNFGGSQLRADALVAVVVVIRCGSPNKPERANTEPAPRTNTQHDVRPPASGPSRFAELWGHGLFPYLYPGECGADSCCAAELDSARSGRTPSGPAGRASPDKAAPRPRPLRFFSRGGCLSLRGEPGTGEPGRTVRRHTCRVAIVPQRYDLKCKT